MRTKKRAKSVSFEKPASKSVDASNEIESKSKDATSASNVAEANVAVKHPEIHKKEEKTELKAVQTDKTVEPKEEPKEDTSAKADKEVETHKKEEQIESKADSDASGSAKASTDKVDELKEDPLVKDLESLKEPEAPLSEVKKESKEEVPHSDTISKEEEIVTESKEEVSEAAVAVKEEKTEVSVDKASDLKKDDSLFNVKGSAFSTSDGLYDKRKKNSLPFFFLVAGVAFVLGLAVMGGGEYLLKSSDIKVPSITSMSMTQPSPTPVPTEIPEPTEEPKKVDLSAFTIKVLNGSGVKGEAAKVKANLTAAGFKVTTTGNADLDDYKETQIQAKKGTDKEFLKQLEAVLDKSYVVDEASTSPSGAAITTDVVVIIGVSTK